MAYGILPDPAILRQAFDYDPETGVIRFKARPRDWFPNNRAYAAWHGLCPPGKIAGSAAGHGYLTVSFCGKNFYAHHIAWAIHHGEPPAMYLDHINGKRTDNRIANLRLVTAAQNLHNGAVRSDNKLTARGVYYDKQRQSYRVRIRVSQKTIYLGAFKNIQDAKSAYARAAIKYFGEYARR